MQDFLREGSVIPYSWKYWRELNLAVGSQIAISNVLADLNLAVAQAVRQTAKFNSPPNFPAIRYAKCMRIFEATPTFS